MIFTDLQQQALERFLLDHAHRQRETRVQSLTSELASLGSAHGYRLIRQMDLVWVRADDYSRQHGSSDTPGFDLMAKLAAHLFSKAAASIEHIKLEPTQEAAEGWRMSCGGRWGGIERKVWPVELLEAFEALAAAEARGERLASAPPPIVLVQPPEEPWRVVVFAREGTGRMHRFSLALDRRLRAGDVKEAAFERAIRTGVLSGGLGDYDLHGADGALVDPEASLWDAPTYPPVYEMRKRGPEGTVAVEVHLHGRGGVFAGNYRREDALRKIVRDALLALGESEHATVIVHSPSLVWDGPIDQDEVVGVLAGKRMQVVFMLELGTVDELTVTVQLGKVERALTSHVTESDTIAQVIAAVLGKIRPPVMDPAAWEILAKTFSGSVLSLGHATRWGVLRSTLFGSHADEISNVLDGAGRGLTARAFDPFPLVMRLRESPAPVGRLVEEPAVVFFVFKGQRVEVPVQESVSFTTLANYALDLLEGMGVLVGSWERMSITDEAGDPIPLRTGPHPYNLEDYWDDSGGPGPNTATFHLTLVQPEGGEEAPAPASSKASET